MQPTEPAVSARLLFEAERAQVRIITFSSELDRLLGGGIARGQVTEFCGAPGLGKTQIGCVAGGRRPGCVPAPANEVRIKIRVKVRVRVELSA